MAENPAPVIRSRPTFAHWGLARETEERLFGVFQAPEPALRKALFAGLLVENATVLLSGTYGTGKTQFVHLVRKLLFSDGAGGYSYDCETCHQELTAFDVLYHLDLAELQRGREVVHPKAFVGARLKFLNEIQRASPGFFNAMLPLLAERRVSYRDHEFEVPPSLCVMDRNPQDSGSSEIPEAFLDRVDFGFEIPALNLENFVSLQALRSREDGVRWDSLEALVEPVMGVGQLGEIWADVRRVGIPQKAVLLAGMFTDALRLCVRADRSTAGTEFDLECRSCQFRGEVCAHLQKVPGTRVTQSVLKLAQALAWLDECSAVRGQDVVAALPWCMAHRIALRPEELRSQPSPLTWVRNVALREIIGPKVLPLETAEVTLWGKALAALERGEGDTLARLGDNDLVVRELALMLAGDGALQGAGSGGGSFA